MSDATLDNTHRKRFKGWHILLACCRATPQETNLSHLQLRRRTHRRWLPPIRRGGQPTMKLGFDSCCWRRLRIFKALQANSRSLAADFRMRLTSTISFLLITRFQMSASQATVPRNAEAAERNIDRTLNQLEPLQRIRLGHAVSPSISVNASSS
jgi:hypothetical protein